MVKEGTLTANGATEEVKTKGGYTMHISGNFGGGSFQMQFQASNGTWVDYKPDEYAFTSADDIRFLEVQNTVVRGVLSGATSPNLFWRFGV